MSIVVICYNKQSEIAGCLESVINQLTTDIELIILDDASKDFSQKTICELLSRNDNSEIRFYAGSKNRGVSRMRNLGIRLALGDYIHFLDGDDQFCEGYLQTLMSVLLRIKPDIVSTQGRWKNSKKVRPPIGCYNGLLIESRCLGCYKVSQPIKMMERYLALGGSQVAFAKKAIGNARFEEKETMFEDFDFYFQWISNYTKWHYLENVWVEYDDNPMESLSRSRTFKQWNAPKAIAHAPSSIIRKRLFSIWILSACTRQNALASISFLIDKKSELIYAGINRYTIGSIAMILRNSIKYFKKCLSISDQSKN